MKTRIFCIFLLFVTVCSLVSCEGSNELPIPYQCTDPNVTELVIPKGNWIITPFSFKDCPSLRKVVITKSVKGIQTNSLLACFYGIDTVIFEKNCQIKEIGKNTFASSSITSIILPDSVTSIGEDAFAYCYNLKEIKLPKNLQTIGKGAFSNCKQLKEITLPENLQVIEENVFEQCYSLESVVMGNKVETIGKKAFYGCYSLKKINFSTSLTTIGENSFRFTQLESPVITGNGLTIKKGAFAESKSTFVEVGPGVTTIENNVFFGCNQLQEVKVTADLQSLDGFRDCKALTSIEIPGSVTKIEDSAFRDCTSLEKVIMGKNVAVIGKYAFFGCSALKDIIWSESLECIGCYAFSSSGLQTVTIPGSVTTISDSAFFNCKNLASVAIGEGVRIIGYNAFSICPNLIRVSLPESLLYLGPAFMDCNNLTEVNSPSNILVMPVNPFKNSPKVASVPKVTEVTENCVRLKPVLQTPDLEMYQLESNDFVFDVYCQTYPNHHDDSERNSSIIRQHFYTMLDGSLYNICDTLFNYRSSFESAETVKETDDELFILLDVWNWDVYPMPDTLICLVKNDGSWYSTIYEAERGFVFKKDGSFILRKRHDYPESVRETLYVREGNTYVARDTKVIYPNY